MFEPIPARQNNHFPAAVVHVCDFRRAGVRPGSCTGSTLISLESQDSGLSQQPPLATDLAKWKNKIVTGPYKSHLAVLTNQNHHINQMSSKSLCSKAEK